MPIRANFFPGEIIRSGDMNTNFTAIYNKPILIPFKVIIGPQVGITTYSLTAPQLTAILNLAALGSTPTMPSLLTLGDIVDLVDGTGPLQTPLIDTDSKELIRGTIVAPLSNVAVNIDFNYPVTGTNIVLVIPVHTFFHALPEDFLRTEFVSSLESDDDIRKEVRGLLSPAEEVTLIATLVPGVTPGGIFWFSQADQQMKLWNSTAVVIMG